MVNIYRVSLGDFESKNVKKKKKRFDNYLKYASV